MDERRITRRCFLRSAAAAAATPSVFYIVPRHVLDALADEMSIQDFRSSDSF